MNWQISCHDMRKEDEYKVLATMPRTGLDGN